MHHYGEAAVKVELSEKTFRILLQNHISGAEITVSGPIEGIFESEERKLDRISAETLGHELAHFLREVLK